MPMSESRRPSRLTWVLLAVAVLLPVGIAIGLPFLPEHGEAVPVHPSPVSHFPASTLPFDVQAIGPEPGYRPRITNVRIVDFDNDGFADILVCDAQRNRVLWYRQIGANKWEEIPLGDELSSPAAAVPVDLDRDGDRDLVVAVLGNVLPSDSRIGQVVWLENQGGKFTNRVLLDDIRRVSDVQVGDLNGDGHVDIAVAVFGYHHGEILWLENRGDGRFRDHLLFTSQGPSHVPLGDFDGDGDLDISALVSQDHEEVWLFENRGGGTFAPHLVHGFLNFDVGSAAMISSDLDKDGKLDLLVAAGDNLEVNHHCPQPWHGCIWLKNLGDQRFEARRIGNVGGVYAAAVADMNGDGHNDVVLGCMFNDWHTPGSASLVLLENDGRQQFTAKMIADQPIHLATVAAGDLNRDATPDVVAGTLQLHHSASRSGRVTAWLSRKRDLP